MRRAITALTFGAGLGAMIVLRRAMPRMRALLFSLALPTTSARGLRFRSWPITEATALEPSLRAMGLKVPASEIDGTAPGGKGACLSDALVSVGPAGRGGTGSFISADGLVRAERGSD